MFAGGVLFYNGTPLRDECHVDSPKGVTMRKLFDPMTLMIGAVAGIAVLAIIAIATNDVWGFVIGLAMSMGLVFGGILRLRAGDKELPTITCLVVAVAGVVLGFVTMFGGGVSVGLGLVDILLAGAVGYAWYQLQTDS